MHAAPLSGSLVLFLAYRLHVLFHLERHKHRIARTARSEQAILLQQIEAKRRSIDDGVILCKVLGIGALTLALIAGAFALDRPKEPPTSTLECVSGYAYFLLALGYVALLPPAVYLINKLRKTGERHCRHSHALLR